MTNPSFPPCPKCGKVPTLIMYGSKFPFVSGVCQCLSDANLIGNSDRTYPVRWENGVDILLGRACRELGIETVEQVRELVGIACDACDERTVRATNRAENLVPLLRRRAVKGEK